MTSAQIRKAFIEFFEAKQHTFVKSAPVVPMDDPTLLFTNAGMNQFKDIFLGTGTRDYSRAVNSQKCIRVSGKHNDLEEVGPSPNHHTFFEMLGNWSFGDYYKAEAIAWAWELLTGVYGLDKSRLYATVFEDDDESAELWAKVTDIDPGHISRHGAKDNFWEMGDTGPCGPCTELHYDLGKPAPGRKPIENDGPNTDSGRYMELWNLVFIQYHRDEEGNLHDLPATHVDTGAGLERIARVLQGVDSNYETDLFQPIIQEIADKSGVPYVSPAAGGAEKDYIPHRAIADHLRMLSFAIADGALPGNEGRGYVLRRVLRRAARFIRQLGIEGAFLADLVPILVKTMGGHFTELKQRQKHIETVIRAEEEAFGRTLDKGMQEYSKILIKSLIESFNDRKHNQFCENFSGQIESTDIDWDSDVHFSNVEIDPNNAESIFSAYFGDLVSEFDKLRPPTLYLEYYTRFNDLLKRLSKSNTSNAIRDEFNEWYHSIFDRPVIPGEAAFELYDTYGFPLDLTQQMATEDNLIVDVEGFNKAMEEAKEKSRAASKFVQGGGEYRTISEGAHSEFVGYDSLTAKGAIRLIRTLDDEDAAGDEKHPVPEEAPSARVAVVLEKTPFYAESGGQVADTGLIRGSQLNLRVTDVRQEGDRRVHYCEVRRWPEGGWDALPGVVEAAVDEERRRAILPHHTTTHLLQAALRAVLGDHVTQAGSRVTPDYMTFDFTHFEKLTAEQIAEVEDRVNRAIREDHPVRAEVMGIDEAKEAGAMALFGEKYGDIVRVIKIGDNGKVSMELCGGTHLSRTGEAGLFRIEGESAVSAGVRRVECTAGVAAYRKMNGERATLDRVTEILGSHGSDPSEKLLKQLEQQKKLEKEIERLKRAALQGSVNFLEDWGEEIEVKGDTALLVFGVYEAAGDRDSLAAAADKIAEELTKAKTPGIGLVGNEVDGTFMFACTVTDNLVQKGVQAGKLVGAVAKKAGGGGGGKPSFATAGSKQVDTAFALLKNRFEIRKIVEGVIGG